MLNHYKSTILFPGLNLNVFILLWYLQDFFINEDDFNV